MTITIITQKEPCKHSNIEWHNDTFGVCKDCGARITK